MIVFQDLTREQLAELLLPLSRINPSKIKSKIKSRIGSSIQSSDSSPDFDAQLEAERARRHAKQARYRAEQIFQWVYQRHVFDWDAMSDLSKDLRAWLKENVRIHRLEEASSHTSLDGTHKFLWRLEDGKTIESVIIPAALSGLRPGGYRGRALGEETDLEEWGRLTACISSQVGCAMGCKFCLTGVQGLDRHLKTYEIVSQVLELRRRAGITNIVFMGMGEPLHNLEAVIQACKILLDQAGLCFSKRKVTVSTSGIVPAIRRLGEEVGVSLAVSLNGTTDEQRLSVMPVNKKWSIEELLAACVEYPSDRHRRIMFEYVLLEGVNDSLEDAERLFQLLRPLPAKVNLIPFNEHPGTKFKRPSDQRVRRFHEYLAERGVIATVRISRGQDILAACGQLRSLFGSARGTEKHVDFPQLSGVSAQSAQPTRSELASPSV